MSNFALKDRPMNTETLKLSQISVNDRNPRSITPGQLQRLVRSILVFPEMMNLRPIAIDETYKALGGNMRYRALTAISEMSPEQIRNELGKCSGYTKKTEAERQMLLDYWERWLHDPTAPIVRADQLTEAQKREFIIKDNVAFGDWDDDILTADSETPTSLWIGVSETSMMQKPGKMQTRMTSRKKKQPTLPLAATPATFGNSATTY